MVAIRQAETVALMFSCYVYTSIVKLNIEWQMTLISTKIILDMIDEIISLMALY